MILERFKGFKKVRTYNSRSFDLTKPEDIDEFGYILRTLKTFDFTGIEFLTVYSVTAKANIHVDIKSNLTLETWLVRMGFEEA